MNLLPNLRKIRKTLKKNLSMMTKILKLSKKKTASKKFQFRMEIIMNLNLFRIILQNKRKNLCKIEVFK